MMQAGPVEVHLLREIVVSLVELGVAGCNVADFQLPFRLARNIFIVNSSVLKYKLYEFGISR